MTPWNWVQLGGLLALTFAAGVLAGAWFWRLVVLALSPLEEPDEQP